MMTIQNATPKPSSPYAILNLGFRIFFVGAAGFAVLSMLLWLLILQGVAPYKHSLSPFYWHGHEMIFGYGLAVVAGFLLTAVKTWTAQAMPYGLKLIPIFGAWILCRLVWFGLHAVPSMTMMAVALVCELVFWGLTTYFVVKAVWTVRQTRQLGVVLNLGITWLCLGLFYVGVFLGRQDLQQQAIYLGFYLIIAMILTIGRRVLPFFIEKGVQVNAEGKPNGVSYQQHNSKLLDQLSIAGLVLFVVFDVFVAQFWVYGSYGASLTALLVAIVNAKRLINWYHKGIWDKSLLWSLYLSFWGLVLGFLFFGVLPVASVVDLQGLNLHSLALHTLALSGIGLTTLAMMSRVSLGHTGRNIHQPPKGVSMIFGLIMVALCCRVILAMFIPSHYMLWVLLSQVAWILAFLLFLWLYSKILSSPRVDGLFG